MNFWPSCGYSQLTCDARGWLVPGDDYLRLFLARPELALVPQSCPAEIALHQALHSTPRLAVSEAMLEALADEDARDNYAMFLRFRDALLHAGSLEACYLQLVRSPGITIAPLFIDLMVQAILRHLLDSSGDALQARAAEMLFRRQRLTVQDGQILSGDSDVVDMLNDTGGLGAVGRLLVQNKTPLAVVNMEVLGSANAQRYWQMSERHTFLLDLTHEVRQDLSHGLTFTMTRARSGLKALAQVLERWVAHLLGVQVSIQPLQQVDDPAWRWHLGLDVDASALLNDLYEDRPVAPERMQRLISLFRLRFAQPEEMRPDVAGKPVYLGLCMREDNTLKLKPHNLLLNLPLRTAS